MAEVLAWLLAQLRPGWAVTRSLRGQEGAVGSCCELQPRRGSRKPRPVVSRALSNPCRKAAASKGGSDRSCRGGVCDPWQERAAGGWSR